MKKRRLLIVGIIAISVCSIIFFSAVYKHNQQEKRKKQEEMAAREFQLRTLIYVTNGKVRDDNSVEIDTKQVIMDIALYNEALSRNLIEGEAILGYMQVQEEVDDYMGGRKAWEECRAINALYDFKKAERCYVDNPEQEVWYDYSHYTTLVEVELGNSIGENVSPCMRHTNSEVEAASKIAAKKWFDEMEGK